MNSVDYSKDIEAFERRIKELKKKTNKMFGDLKSEVKSIRERDPAATSDLEVALLYSGFHAVLAYRLSHKLYEHDKHFAAYDDPHVLMV